jgi:hypothetical protein
VIVGYLIVMADRLSEDAIRARVLQYKATEDWEENKRVVDQTSRAVRRLAEALIDHYDGAIGQEELTTLYRLCQIPDAAGVDTKKGRIDELQLPESEKEAIKAEITGEIGIVGSGKAVVELPEEYEEAAYTLIDTLVTASDQDVLDSAIDEFAEKDISGTQAGVLSPILFHLHPDKYPVINEASQEGMQAILGHEISSQLSDYTAEAARYREFRDKYDLGRDEGNLRDVDWFFYTYDDIAPSVWVEKTSIHAPYKEIDGGELALGRALISPQESAGGRDIYKEMREASPGDIVVHLRQDTKTLAGVSVIEGEVETDYDFPDAVLERWKPAQRDSGGYLRRLFNFEEFDDPPAIYDDILDNVHYRHRLKSIYEEHDGLFYDRNNGLVQGGYLTYCPDELVDVLADASSELSEYLTQMGFDPDHIQPEENDEQSYWLWNTNKANENTDGTAAFERGVAAAYGDQAYGDELARISKGDIVFAYLTGVGVVGVGEALENSNGEPINPTDPDTDPIKDTDVTEYHLPVDWRYTLSEDNAISISETADYLSREKMSHVGTAEKPSDQDGAGDLYEAVRERYIELQRPSDQTEHAYPDIRRLISEKKQLVFYGPPGTGKTYTALRFAEWLRAKEDQHAPGRAQVQSVTFHPSFSYEDFLEGFTAEVENNDVGYGYEKGTFAEIVEDAKSAYEAADDKNDAPPFVLIIDEINRGNLAQIFGESITLLEADKRLNQANEVTSRLAHSGEEFVIPPNLYVIGTMNTADESIALVDTALRRRFRFLSFPPEISEVRENYSDFRDGMPWEIPIKEGGEARNQLLAASVLAIQELNSRIINLDHLGKGKQIGHTYLLGLESPQAIVDTWRFEILPQLEEHYFSQFKRLKSDLFSDVESDIINWDQKQINAFDAETLYNALCDLAGIPGSDRADLELTAESGQFGRSEISAEAGQQADDPWVHEKSRDSFIDRIEDRLPDSDVETARNLLEIGEELGYLDPGSGDSFATISAKSDQVDPRVGVFVIRENGNFSFKFPWLLGRDENDLTEENLIPVLDILDERDNFKVEYSSSDSGIDMEDVKLSLLSEADIQAIKDVYAEVKTIGGSVE